jgi:outer membrane protein OmpA-like peptidoglycan-associated protein
VANSNARQASERAQLSELSAEARRLEAELRREIEAQAAALPPVPLSPPPPPPVPPPPLAEPVPLQTLQSFAKLKDAPDAVTIVIPASLVFEAGQAGLTQDARERLDQVAAVLRSRTERISVEVHTDSLGLRSDKESLSARRARAVVDYLVAHGVHKERIESHGRGDTQPLVDNATEENRATNRRLEIVLRVAPVS